MKTALLSRKLWRYVSKGIAEISKYVKEPDQKDEVNDNEELTKGLIRKNVVKTFMTLVTKAKSAEEAMDVVSSDTCGPFRPSKWGHRYVLTFRDHATKRTWVYLLNNKK